MIEHVGVKDNHNRSKFFEVISSCNFLKFIQAFFYRLCTRSNTWNGAVSFGARVPVQRSIKLSSLPSVWFLCKPTLW